MDKWAAPQAAIDTSDGERAVDLAAVSRALLVLRLAWGDVYLFGHDEQGYWAARYHAGTGVLRAETPEEMGERCAADCGADL